MSKRTRRKAGKKSAPSRGPAPPPPGGAPTFPRRHPLAWALLGGALVLGVVLWLRFGGGPAADPVKPADTPGPQAKGKKDQEEPPGKKQPAEKAKDPGDSFLEDFGKKDGTAGKEAGGALTNAELEKKVLTLLDLDERYRALLARVGVRMSKLSAKELQAAETEADHLAAEAKAASTELEKDLLQARQARPDDAMLDLLGGEVLLVVGGRPEEEILPRLRRAIERGVKPPRAFASLSRAEVRAGQPEEAFRSAVKALDLGGNNRYAWNAFTTAAFNTERFGEVVARLDERFAKDGPDWAVAMRREAVAWQARCQAEQTCRAADQRAGDLPRVRLLIEHRRFARDKNGRPLTTIESTGKGALVIELFEDQAPATVANFLTLVEQQAYDGTRFFAGEGGNLIVGGDPKSRGGDPKDDGLGGPGYFIPDEFDRRDARGHFRGSLGMANTGPGTAGSQFYFTLAPRKEMNGRHTVFGRVVEGQEVLERITLGRTNRQVGRSGRIIPGDLLVRAEVLRKRPHEYKVIKVQPK